MYIIGKKGGHGISVLFLFLAILVISTITSGLLITNVHKLSSDGGKMVDPVLLRLLFDGLEVEERVREKALLCETFQ